MKYYKGTYNQRCINLTFEPNKTYTLHGQLRLCDVGFHCCKNPNDIFEWYKYTDDFVLLEIDVLGNVLTDTGKVVTDKLTVTRIVPKQEHNTIFTQCKFDSNNKLTERKGPGNYYYKYSYNDKGDLTLEKSSTGLWWAASYDDRGNCTEEVNSNGYRIKYEYNDSGLLVREKDSYDYRVKYSYNDKGNLTLVENSLGAVTTYSYDSQDNLTLIDRLFDGTQIGYCYDARGNVIKKHVNGKSVYKIEIT